MKKLIILTIIFAPLILDAQVNYRHKVKDSAIIKDLNKIAYFAKEQWTLIEGSDTIQFFSTLYGDYYSIKFKNIQICFDLKNTGWYFLTIFDEQAFEKMGKEEFIKRVKKFIKN